MVRNRASNRAARRRDPHVAREREVEPGADRRAVHRRDGRQRRVQHPEEAVVDVADRSGVVALAVGVGERGEGRDVGAGAERRGLPR